MGHKVSKTTHTKIEGVSEEGVGEVWSTNDDRNSQEPTAKYQNFIVGHEDGMGASGGIQEDPETDGKSHSGGGRKPFGRRNSKISPTSVAESREEDASFSASEICKSFITSSSGINEPANGKGDTGTTHGKGVEPVPFTESKESGVVGIVQFYNIMMEGHSIPYLYDPYYILIIDVRAKKDYESLHILTAVHVSDLSESLFVSSLSKYVRIVLYDQDGRTHCLADSPLSQLQLRLKDVEAEALEGGFDAWLSRHPYLCTDQIIISELQREEAFFTYPSMILDDWLFQGAGQHATNEKIISDLGITHVINVGHEHPSPFKDRIQYLQLNVTDDLGSSISNSFPKSTEFIRHARQGKGKVLVHCNLGISRSSAINLAYLMSEFYWTLKDAHQLLKNRRNIIRPNFGFLKQLSEYEKTVFGKKFTDIDKL